MPQGIEINYEKFFDELDEVYRKKVDKLLEI
jgi:hypothetical protein